MLSDEQFEIIVTSIEAAMQPQLWNKTLDILVDACAGVSGNLTVIDRNYEIREALAMSRFIREDAFEMYLKFMQREDSEDTEAVVAIYNAKPNQLVSEYQTFSVSSYEDLPSSTFRDWQRDQFGIVNRYGLKLNQSGPWADILLLHIDRDLAPDEVRHINQVSTVMSSSIKLFRVMEQLRSRFNAALGALDNLGIGCFLTLNGAQVIHRNRIADDILDQHDGLTIGVSGHLTTWKDTTNSAIATACDKALETANARNRTAEATVLIERPSRKASYVAIVHAIIDVQAELERGLRCALVFVVDPESATRLDVDGLVKLGGLTPAEADVCQLLVDGRSTTEICNVRDVSENTARQQIKQVLTKLGCTSRIELLRLAIDTRVPIDPRRD